MANDLGPDRKLDDGRGGIWVAEFEASVWACAVPDVPTLELWKRHCTFIDLVENS